MLLVNAKNGAQLFYTNDTERMRITSGGIVNIGISTASTYGRLIVNAGTNQNIWVRSSGGIACFEATNDAVSANVPMRFAATEYSFASGGNMLVGTSTDNGNRLQVNGAITFGSGGCMQSLNDTVNANSTRTYTITGVLAGGIQIMVGAFGNGTGNTSRAFWVGGGYLQSALPYTEVLRVNDSTIVISAITSNTTSSVFTITNNFGFNSALVGITIISGGAIGNPTITAS
jgi:hypothetical protein